MKTILITGASGNLGQALVKKFLGEKYRVIGTIVPNDPVKMDISDPSFETVTVNLMDEKETGNFMEKIISTYSSIDAAVLTVGGFAMGGIEETSLEDVSKMIRLNFETAYNTSRPLLKQMKQQGSGRIFLVGARPGLETRHGKGMFAYSISKSLVFRLAEHINMEAKGTNVTASVVIPSTIDTPQNRKAMPDADPSKWVTAEAIASIIYFYCTNEAAQIREPVIKVYGQS